MSLYRILGGIYLSSAEPLTSGEDLSAQGITHILSILPGPIPKQYTDSYVHKQIEVNDEETTNIIRYFPETNDFIEKALFKSDTTKHSNKILIHCAQGVSRSPTIIIAFLMYKYKLSLPQALHAVKRKSASVGPNEGFMEQLKLYQQLEFDVDMSNKLYKQFVIDLSIKQDPSGSSLKDMNLFTASDPEALKSSSEVTTQYRCKRCRHVLATNLQIENHVQPTEESQQSKFIKRGHTNRIISVQQASTVCSHHFILQPLDWMTEELAKSEIEGKFNCPTTTCGAKIGGYSWKGSRCSCGKWVIPALHLQTSRVDEVKVIKK
ncbi:tyrosine-protein phosphatase Yvh1p [[Candida] anglica]|uniref:protein-tyrosine-phosphatase n=1 Tax=[Candida] anglica TaxID=148631 RepID=A0ABP0ECJ0_9ASCO